MDFNKLRTDPALELEGVWKEIGEGGRIKVAAANNQRFREIFRKKTEAYDQAIAKRTLSDEESNKILVEVMAETILLSWEGFTDNGKSVEPTLENRIKYLTDVSSFRDTVTTISQNIDNYRKAAEAAAAKNSVKDSAGTSTT